MSSAVPEGWELKSVGEICKVKRGASPRPIKDPKWWGGSVGWVRISDVTSSRKYLTKTTQYLSDEGVEKSVQIGKGEVVLSICATIGRPIIVGVDACIHDGFVWFDGLKEYIYREYWYYFLASKEEFLSSQRQSGTQGNLNTSIVGDLVCPLPPLPEQQKIATILSSVDDVITKITAQIDKLKDLKTGMMQELLTKGIGHTEFKDSPVGRIPVGWDVVQLKLLVEKIYSGWSPVCEPRPRTGSEWGILKTTAVVWSGYEPTENKVLSSSHDPVENAIVRNGDILVTRKGPRERVGVCVYVQNTPEKLMVPDTVLRVILKENIDINPEFVSLALSSESIQLDWDTKKVGLAEAQVNVNHQILNATHIVLPDIDEQKKICAVISMAQKEICIRKEKLKAIQRVKKALMQDLLTGAVRVTVDA
jgi:type I restriction enzyme, S subunit